MSPVFINLKSLCSLREEVQPFVVVTHNDLVFCTTSQCFQRYYYICNPHTGQCLVLPPALVQYERTPVGFMFDVPGEFVVVRIINQPSEQVTKAEIFSSKIGEWRESVVARGFPVDDLDSSVSYDVEGGMYWKSSSKARANFLIRFKKINGGVDDQYECSLWEFDDAADVEEHNMFRMGRLAMRQGGSPWLWSFDYATRTLSLLELYAQVGDGNNKLRVKHKMPYTLHQIYDALPVDISSRVKLLRFDPARRKACILL